jgi:hypothetical protein
MAIGSSEFNEELAIFNEALKQDLLPNMDSFKEYKKNTFVYLDKAIRSRNRSSCFRNEIYKTRHLVDTRSIVFTIDEDDVPEIQAREEL